MNYDEINRMISILKDAQHNPRSIKEIEMTRKKAGIDDIYNEYIADK